MSAFDLDEDLALAHALADEARAISLALFRGRFVSRQKADGSIVTEVDEAIEDLIRTRLESERPGDAMLGEERGQTGDGPRRWIVDAIDGTHSFATGSEEWGTLIGLEVDGEIVAGVCDMAPIDRRYWAAQGRGAFRRASGADAVRLGVSAGKSLEDARCFVPAPHWMRGEDLERGRALGRATRPEEGDDHPALLVAAGRLEIAAFFMGGPWDIAAPAIIVREAGGEFTDLHGGRSIARGGGLFSNARLHDAALALVRRE